MQQGTDRDGASLALPEKRPPNGERGGGKRTTERLQGGRPPTPPSRDPTRANAGGMPHKSLRRHLRAPRLCVGGARKRGRRRVGRAEDARARPRGGARSARPDTHAAARGRVVRVEERGSVGNVRFGSERIPSSKRPNKRPHSPLLQMSPPSTYKCSFPFLGALASSFLVGAVGPSSSRRFCTAIIRQHGPPAQRLQIRSGRL